MAEEDREARTWMLLTAGTLAVSALAVLVVSTAGGAAGRVLIATLVPPVVIANLAAIADMLAREWLGASLWELATGRRPPSSGLPALVHVRGRSLPWRLLRVVDHYFAMQLAWALALLCFWAWDADAQHQTYMSIAGELTRRNVWAAWISLVVTTLQVFNSAGFAQIILTHPASEAVSLAMVATSGLTQLLLFGMVAGEGFERAHAARKRAAADDAVKPLRELNSLIA